jgi:dUTP pyrophosphatase
MSMIKVLDAALYPDELESGFGSKHPDDAGIDLRAAIDTKVVAGETAAIPHGVAVALPIRSMGLVVGRSSASTTRALMIHPGIIDQGYRGVIHGMVTALGAPVHIARGDRICQLIIIPIIFPGWTITDDLGETERGLAGLGSTGLK